MTKPASRSGEDNHGTSTDPLEEAKRIMKRLTEMPPREHKDEPSHRRGKQKKAKDEA
jgi:hypothetical protein